MQVGDMRDGARRTHENIWKDLMGQDSVERRRGHVRPGTIGLTRKLTIA